jgi:hypothetical protein
MAVTKLVESTFLSRTSQAIRDILSANTVLNNLLKDTKKPDEPVIGNQPINWKMAIKNTVTVHHTLRQYPFKSPSNGEMYLVSTIYIDIFLKENNKDKILQDELDKLAWTVLSILFDATPDLNFTCDGWEFYDKQIWAESPSSQKIEEKIQPDRLNNMICQLTLIIYHQASL